MYLSSYKESMRKPYQRFSYANRTGFAMVEVLVTIVIISFGLLGLAGMQITGMRNSHGAYMRSLATQQAYDMADRLRANQIGVLAGNYNSLSGIPALDTCITAAAPGCTAAQLATQDARQWNTSNGLLLPSGQGAVCLDSSPNDGTPAATACSGSGPFVIKIWWNDDKSGTAPLKLFAISFQP